MAESTLKLDFQAMQIRAAEELSLADYSGSAAAVPTDTVELDLVKRLVNDAVRAVYSMHDWNWLRVRHTITLVADTSEYSMPDYFAGDADDTFTYESDGPFTELQERSDAEIRRMFAGDGDSAGDPVYYAFRPQIQTDGTFLPWKVVFYPVPTTEYDVTITLKHFGEALSANTDRHLGGARYDFLFLSAIKAFCKEHEDGAPAMQNPDFLASFQNAIRMDAQGAPRRLGYNADRSEPTEITDRRMTARTTTYNGASIL